MYNLIFQNKAEKFLKKLDKNDFKRITKKLEELKENPQLGKPLTANLSGLWSLRVGNYRAIYEIRQEVLIIFVLRINHRKNIYT